MHNTGLDEFLARHNRVSRSTSSWPNGIELLVTGYLTAETPPQELVSSVRGIVLRGDLVLVMENLDGPHILPGGRVEEGETQEETLKREVLEEAGVAIEIGEQVGFVHLRHMTPKPKDHPYPYPDFFWPVYAASFAHDSAHSKVQDDYDISSKFLPIEEVRGLEVDEHEKPFLEAILAKLD